jgi:hypothetical protein
MAMESARPAGQGDATPAISGLLADPDGVESRGAAIHIPPSGGGTLLAADKLLKH